ncbi:MAG: stage II sporulation protein M [Thaumarchaeota archaeon]|nr:stage II sporulation protein M [Nitrososphaerota archaeon]
MENLENELSGELEGQSRWDRAVRDYAVRGLLLCLTLFLIEVGVLFLVPSIPFFPGEKGYYISQANQLSNTTSHASGPQLFYDIFTNNYRISLIEMIPGLGVIFFAISMYVTARVSLAIAFNEPQPVPGAVLVILLFILPHSYLELPAYAVATAEGLYLLYAIIKVLSNSRGGDEGRMTKEVWQLGINVLIVTVMLAVAALFETTEIVLGAFNAFLTWIPFIGIAYLVYRLNKRLSEIRKEAQMQVQPSRATEPTSG